MAACAEGLDIGASERLVKGLGVPWSGPILNVAEAEAAAEASTEDATEDATEAPAEAEAAAAAAAAAEADRGRSRSIEAAAAATIALSLAGPARRSAHRAQVHDRRHAAVRVPKRA